MPHFVDVFRRVTAALSASVPFDRSTLVVLDEGQSTRVFDFNGANADGTPLTGSRLEWSERLWPQNGGAHAAVHDAQSELTRDAAGDGRLLELGARSVLTAPLTIESRLLGLAVFTSRSPGVYGPAHVAGLSPMLEVVALAIEHERLWAVEQHRHLRHTKLAALLPAIAGALDVRQTFLQLAKAIQEVVPHDLLAFALVDADGKGARVQAATDHGLLELPPYRFTNPEETHAANWDFLLAYDIEAIDAEWLRCRISPREAPDVVEVTVKPGAAWVQFITRAKVRSTMRVPIRVKDRRLGGIAFFSRRADAYHEEDAVLGGRIADHVALALAHQELADEARRIAQAEARAQMLEVRVDHLSRELERFSAHRALGESAAWKQALADATRVASTDTTVLITGESGTGKEVLARFIHRGSRRAQGPFVAINCAALPAELLESELFGHERGAFTGAVAARAGKIEQAAGGVLFLDEVGEMSPNVQAKFLRVLQEREYQRLGGTRTLKADVRIVAATNRDPRRAVEEKQLREDLYYRLGVFEIHLPPLRERPEDILVLAQGFLEEIGNTIGRPAAGISEDAAEVLVEHSWPGNVRELRNTIERALILCHGGLITREHLPAAVIPAPVETMADATGDAATFPLGGVRLESIQRELVEKALAEAAGNKSQAAKLLGLPRGRLYSLMRRYQLTDARR
ncbi:MAG: sigma 54-interacting transcriptional regulator [Gemmatimonadota bacterium]